MADALLLIEKPRPSQRREFIADCPHGTTRLLVDNYPRTDRARGSGIWGRLIEKHRHAMEVALGQGEIAEPCACQVPDSARPS